MVVESQQSEVPGIAGEAEVPAKIVNYHVEFVSRLGAATMEIPPRFRSAASEYKDLSASDEKTDIPLLERETRPKLAGEVGVAFKDGKTVGAWVCDLDQLKIFNDLFGREAGDEAIIWSTAFVTQLVDKLSLSCKVAVLRSAQASDETYVFFLGMSAEDEAKIKAALEAANQAKQTLELPDKKSNPKPVSLSASSGFCTTKEIPFNVAQEELLYLQGSAEGVPAWRVIKYLTKEADKKAHDVKEEKQYQDWTELKKEINDLPINEFAQKLLDTYGGARVSRRVQAGIAASLYTKAERDRAAGRNVLSEAEVEALFEKLGAEKEEAPEDIWLE